MAKGVYKNTPELFWSFIDKQENGCWNWTRGISGDGYGRFCLYGKSYSTHTLAYKLFNNLNFNQKVYICHTCDNKLCIRPHHLYFGSNQTNTEDKMRLGRAKGLFTKESPTVFKKGNIPASRKISEATARDIKMDLQTMRQCDVIRRYNLPRDTVRNIARGVSWASLEVAS